MLLIWTSQLWGLSDHVFHTLPTHTHQHHQHPPAPYCPRSGSPALHLPVSYGRAVKAPASIRGTRVPFLVLSGRGDKAASFLLLGALIATVKWMVSTVSLSAAPVLSNPPPPPPTACNPHPNCTRHGRPGVRNTNTFHQSDGGEKVWTKNIYRGNLITCECASVCAWVGVCACVFVCLGENMNVRDKKIKTGWLDFFFFFF